MRKIYILICCCFLSIFSFSQNAGELFTEFGTNGKVNTNIGQADYTVVSQFIQNDGKILIFGNIENREISETFVLRLNADGSLDTSFDTDGKLELDQMEFAVKVLTQSDGKIILGGNFEGNPAFVRLLANGELDSTFGNNGLINETGTNYDRSLNDFVIQSDGKILALSNFNSGSQDYRVLRYNTNGLADTSFGNNGSITTDIGNTEFSKCIILQPDGKFLVGGTTLISSIPNIFIARYNSNGTLDNSFNSNGRRVFSYTLINNFFNLDIQSDGKIVFVFSNYTSSVPRINVVRLNSNSSLDTTFATNGIITNTAPNNFGNGVKKFKILSDGEFLIVCNISPVINGNSNNNILIHRLNSNGSLDTTLNGNGFLEYSYFSYDDVASDFSTIGNQVLISGNTEETLLLNKIAISKINNNGSFDSTFDTDGRLFYFFPKFAFDESTCSVKQNDGKVILAGISHVNGNEVLSACRYNIDGSIDTNFGSNGFFTYNNLFSDTVKGIKVDSNGKIVIVSGQTFIKLLRLNSNGTVDTTFGTNGFANFNSSSFSSGNDLKILNDNSILVVGTTTTNTGQSLTTDFFLAKVDNNGNLVQSFGTNGSTTLSSTANFDELLKVDTLSDGKIITIGTFQNTNGNADIVVFKCNANGSLDTSFNTTGIFTIGIPNSADSPVSLAIQSDDKIMIADNYNNLSNSLLFKLNPNGSLDTTFDIDGIIYLDPTKISYTSAILPIINNKFIISGTVGAEDNDFIVAKFNNNGSIDNGFGNNGYASVDFFNNYDLPSNVLISNDNNIILTGVTIVNNETFDFALCKLYLENELSNNDIINKPVSLFYPNPATSIIYLSDDVKDVEIVNIQGKKINSIIIHNTIQLDHLETGIYILQMKLENGTTINQKLIKK